jgi:hypothetical protein
MDSECQVDAESTTMADLIRIANASAVRIDKQRAAAAKAQEARAVRAAAAEPSGAPLTPQLPAPSAPSVAASNAIVPAAVPDVPQLILQDGNIVVNPASLQVRVRFWLLFICAAYLRCAERGQGSCCLHRSLLRHERDLVLHSGLLVAAFRMCCSLFSRLGRCCWVQQYYKLSFNFIAMIQLDRGNLTKNTTI